MNNICNLLRQVYKPEFLHSFLSSLYAESRKTLNYPHLIVRLISNSRKKDKIIVKEENRQKELFQHYFFLKSKNSGKPI